MAVSCGGVALVVLGIGCGGPRGPLGGVVGGRGGAR